MKAEIKTQWLEALRSGKYQQAKNYLRPTDHSFCCLGVLCDLVAPKAWTESDVLYTKYLSFGRTGYLPDAVREMSGLTTDEADEAMRMNDNGQPFESIAAWIEERVPAETSQS